MDYVRKDLVHAYLQCGRNKALSADVIHELIEQIPIADVREVMASAWIPVSERLPEKNQECLICTVYQYVTTGEFFHNSWYDDDCIYDKDKVTAWIPLPESYRGDK